MRDRRIKEKIKIDKTFQKMQKHDNKIAKYTHRYTQTCLWTSTCLVLIWGAISTYNQTALLAIPLTLLAIIEEKTW